MKRIKAKKITNLRWLIITLAIFLGGSIYMASNSGTGPLSFLTSPSSINETKTICTRKTDGRKDCTTYETSTDDGIKTTTTKSEIISDTGGVKKVVEYKYDVVKTTPVNNAGTPTGNSTTTEVRKKVTEDKEEVLSTVTTVQKPVILDPKGLPTAAGEVVSEVRTGDISLGVNPQDTRTPEQKCTQDKNGQSTGNKWENDSCVMQVVSIATPSEIPPASSVSVGVNCDKGMCSTSGSPVCYGSYASTGQYLKDASGNSTGEYDCRLCGDNGSGGVGFTGGPQSCKTLLAQNKPVVLGPDANPSGLGLPTGTHTGSCLSKRGADWILAAVGQPGEGPNEGKVCDVTGTWSAPIPPETPKTIVPTPTPIPTPTPEVLCKPGKGTLEGKEVMISCSLTGAPTYTFCYGGTGTFDAQGVCQINLASPATGTQVGGTNSDASRCRYGTTSQYASRGLYACNLTPPNDTPAPTEPRRVNSSSECDQTTETAVSVSMGRAGGYIECRPIGSNPSTDTTKTSSKQVINAGIGLGLGGSACFGGALLATPFIGPLSIPGYFICSGVAILGGVLRFNTP